MDKFEAAQGVTAECHLYHNGDHPLQGNGASARGVADRRTVNELLNAGADAR